MPDIHDLLRKMAAEEAAFAETRFVAPCVRGGRVRARVAGVVQAFTPAPRDFEGWGVFRADGRRARLVEEAGLPLVAGYLARFPRLRLRLARPLSGQTWLAYPDAEADMRQRFREAKPVPVHLVSEGMALEVVTARSVGGAWWFEETDRRADPMAADRLRDALNAVTEPSALAFKGLTPEMRAAYDIATQDDERFPAFRERRAAALEAMRREAEEQWLRDFPYGEYDEAQPPSVPTPPNRRGSDTGDSRDARRLREALAVGGGEMRGYSDRGAYFLVEWTTADGVRHTSAVAKADLTVVSSGICLSGRDNDFDLQSLVGVIEKQGDGW